jgi:hypothetical protein
MPSVLAIISKAVFEKMVAKTVAVGDVVDTERYVSSQAVFNQLGPGDAIFLVTVRPPNEQLWLVAVLEGPKRKKDAWVAAANTHPITDITSSIKKLEFTTGTGIKAKKGALGMSLQTPRVLTAGDVALLRGGTPAVAAYRQEVAATPAAQKAEAEGKRAAKDGEILRLVNYRKPFEMLDRLPKAQLKQLTRLTRNNNAGKPANLVNHEDWAPMELVDVLDVAANTVTHQLYIWPWGSGELFVHDTTDRAAAIIQHGFTEQKVDDLAFRKALAAAYATAKPRLAEVVDFNLNPKPSQEQLEREETQRDDATYQELVKLVGKSDERYRDFEDFTPAQQKAIRAAVRSVGSAGLAARGVDSLGFPPETRLGSWSGHSERDHLETRAGKWPVWKWLKEAIAGRVGDADAVAAITQALSKQRTLRLGGDVCHWFYDYDLWGENLYDRSSGAVATPQERRVAGLIAAIVDAADLAVEYAAAVQQPSSKESGLLMAGVASLALAARAKRRKERFPSELLSPKALARELKRIQRESK